jgi:hypothetical protein
MRRFEQQKILLRIYARNPRLVLSAARRWWLMGGQTDRHPQHNAAWGTITGFLGIIWGYLYFNSHNDAAHVIAWICFGVAAYIVASFFSPLPLIPLRDERKVEARRVEEEKKMRGVIAALAESLRELQERERERVNELRK